MKIIAKSVIAGVIALAAASAAQAVPTIHAYNSLTNPEAGIALTVDFTGAATGNCASTGYAACSGNWSIFSNSTPSVTTSPTGVAGNNFLSVPNPLANGVATFTTPVAYNYFGLLWGTVDAYNTLSFSNGYSITGTQLETLFPAIVNDDGVLNRYITFSFGSGSGFTDFTSVTFSSTNFAFESDNHTFKRVTEPGTLALFGIGLVGMALASRRRRFN